VRVYTRIKEGDKERTQYFEGLVIRRKGGIGPSGTFTVRRIASGVGVERTFPVHSPVIERVVVNRGAKTRRATLYTIRGLTGKAARLTEQPVDKKSREIDHPWPHQYKVEHKELKAVEEAATEEQLAEEEAEATAAQAEKGDDPKAASGADATDDSAPKKKGKQSGDAAGDTVDSKDAKAKGDPDAAKAEKTKPAAKQDAKDAPKKDGSPPEK
jgi:large subunit ribosomal protein L19